MLMRLGQYSIDRNPTYAGAATALGPTDSCRLVKNRFLGDTTQAIELADKQTGPIVVSW